jgi:NADH-quinone oxidoreductase subunit G
LKAGAKVRVTQGEGTAVLVAHEDTTLAADTVRVSAGHPSTASLGALFGTVAVEKVNA